MHGVPRKNEGNGKSCSLCEKKEDKAYKQRSGNTMRFTADEELAVI